MFTITTYNMYFGYSIKYLFILYILNIHIIMTPSHKAITLIKQSDMTKEQLTIFLPNILKEALLDYLIR